MGTESFAPGLDGLRGRAMAVDASRQGAAARTARLLSSYVPPCLIAGIGNEVRIFLVLIRTDRAKPLRRVLRDQAP